MKKIIQVTGPTPQRAVASSQVKDCDLARLDDILAWAGVNLRGTVWWAGTQFRDRHAAGGYSPIADSRKKHFKDGYWVYRFWFSRKADAALFILWWGRFIHNEQ